MEASNQEQVPPASPNDARRTLRGRFRKLLWWLRRLAPAATTVAATIAILKGAYEFGRWMTWW